LQTIILPSGALYMRLEEAFSQIEHKIDRDVKKRFACSHCGKTWVEIVGLFAGKIEGTTEIFFQLGQESEICQNCKFKINSCPTCGSKDTYEISFSSDSSIHDSPLSFDRIRIVSSNQ
jgi:hypothetical protein